jgi:GGDEF domain-containing protein
MIEQSPTSADGINISYTISIGAIEVDQQHISLEAALDAADNRLYAAKRRGRNRLVF